MVLVACCFCELGGEREMTRNDRCIKLDGVRSTPEGVCGKAMSGRPPGRARPP
ncbi:hypothetical protein OF83DRAFT_1111936, partial [Amylostereum chailletii]